MGSRKENGAGKRSGSTDGSTNGDLNGSKSNSKKNQAKRNRETVVVAPTESKGMSRGDLIGRRVAVATSADKRKGLGSSNNNSGRNSRNSSRPSSGNTSANESSKKSRKKNKSKSQSKTDKAYRDSQLMLGNNRNRQGSIYSALARGYGEDDGSDEEKLTNQVIILDDDDDDEPENAKEQVEETVSQIKRDTTASKIEEQEAETKAEVEAEPTDEVNGLTANQDFIAFTFSDDEDEGEDDDNETSRVEESGSNSESEKSTKEYSPSYNDNTEPNSHKRKRDLSDDEDDSAKSKKHNLAVPKKRLDMSLEFPWINRGDHSQEREVADWLTKEIKDFVAYVSPSQEEIHARNDAVTRIQNLVTDLWPDAELKVFGSYATDMYLPGSDIDMVVLSKSGKYDSRAYLYQLSSRLKSSGIAISVEVIAKARVPIIKFVEKESSIHIDVSFERTNGVMAVETIRKWAQEFPCLRYLVMVVKQFLARRKMNNVHTGGLGGYAVICIVTHFLKMQPKLASGSMDAEKNLGVLMIEFFELYGKHFNYDSVALKMTGDMGYLPKRRHPDMQQQGNRSQFSLAIQDPMDSSNNISRGSFNTRGIKQAFSGAFNMLTTRCYELEYMPFRKRRGLSILGNIIRVKGPERDFIDSTGLVHNIAHGPESSSPSPASFKPPPPSTAPKQNPPPPSKPSKEGNSSAKYDKEAEYARKPSVGTVEYMELTSDEEDDENLKHPSNSKNASALSASKLASSSSSTKAPKKSIPTDFITITSSDSDSDSGVSDKENTTKTSNREQTNSSGISPVTSNNSVTQDSRTAALPTSQRRDYWLRKGGILNEP